MMKQCVLWKPTSLIGKGLGHIDIHVLASAVLSETPLWTLDRRRLSGTALMLKMHYKP
jgi:hypothetical protein